MEIREKDKILNVLLLIIYCIFRHQIAGNFRSSDKRVLFQWVSVASKISQDTNTSEV